MQTDYNDDDALADYATHLVVGGRLKALIEARVTEYLDELLSTSPNQTDVRESKYYKIKALEDFQIFVESIAR